MKNKVGLWIDHRKIIVVLITDAGEEIKKIESGDKMTDSQIVAKVRERFPA